MSDHLTYTQLRDAARAMYAARRNQIERAEAAHEWREKRPEVWFIEQRRRLQEIAQMGGELAFIADHEASYQAWKAGMTK